ncbi:MAG: hypothetical protein ABJJ53_16335 [Sulfitobacter sp.]
MTKRAPKAGSTGLALGRATSQKDDPMQLSASLSDTTATIAVNHMNTNTSLTITDATNLATDLAPFEDGDAPAVDRSSFTTSGKGPDQSWSHRDWKPGYGFANDEFGLNRYPATKGLGETAVFGPKPGPDYNVHGRGYRLDATDDGVRITTLPTSRNAMEGKITIPRDQIASIIAQLNA